MAEILTVAVREANGKSLGDGKTFASSSCSTQENQEMIDRIVQTALNSFVADLRATHGGNLYAVVLYGAGTAGEDESRADFHVLVALNRITPEDLRQSQAPTREWQRLGYSLPTYFTTEELQNSADVFPIEFYRMKRSRVVLYGHDPFEKLEISDANLRHQTEYELRSKLLQLRRLYIPASVSADKLCDLMTNSLSSFAALFTSVLLLEGRQPTVAKMETVRAVTQLVGGQIEPFEAIRARCDAKTDLPSLEDATALFGRYFVEIERVIEHVNQLT